MKRANPVDMRKALVVADEYKKAGILFVPMPVLNKADGDALCNEAFRRLDILEKEAEDSAAAVRGDELRGGFTGGYGEFW